MTCNGQRVTFDDVTRYKMDVSVVIKSNFLLHQIAEHKRWIILQIFDNYL